MPKASATTRIDRCAWAGWAEAFRLSNGEAELVVVPAVSRILHYGLVGGPNLLWQNASVAGRPPGAAQWTNYGGSKTWIWPEHEWTTRSGERLAASDGPARHDRQHGGDPRRRGRSPDLVAHPRFRPDAGARRAPRGLRDAGRDPERDQEGRGVGVPDRRLDGHADAGRRGALRAADEGLAARRRVQSLLRQLRRGDARGPRRARDRAPQRASTPRSGWMPTSWPGNAATLLFVERSADAETPIAAFARRRPGADLLALRCRSRAAAGRLLRRAGADLAHERPAARRERDARNELGDPPARARRDDPRRRRGEAPRPLAQKKPGAGGSPPGPSDPRLALIARATCTNCPGGPERLDHRKIPSRLSGRRLAASRKIPGTSVPSNDCGSRSPPRSSGSRLRIRTPDPRLRAGVQWTDLALARGMPEAGRRFARARAGRLGGRPGQSTSAA